MTKLEKLLKKVVNRQFAVEGRAFTKDGLLDTEVIRTLEN